MKTANTLLALLAVLFLAALYSLRQTPSVTVQPVRAPTHVRAPIAPLTLPETPKQEDPRPSATATSERQYKDWSFAERRTFVAELRKRDHAVIFQAWIDADRVDHDARKHGILVTTLTSAMADRPPSPEFLAQLEAFVNDSSNTLLDRQIILGVLGGVQRPETVDLLMKQSANAASSELRNSALASLATTGIMNDQDESLAPKFEEAWRSTSNADQLRSTARALAQLGAASSMELLLTAALAPDGTDDAHRQAARYVLASTTIQNDHAVPPLAARLSTETPTDGASQLAGGVLARMVGAVPNRALLAWMQKASAATPVARVLALSTQSPAIWQAGIGPSEQFRDEQNREAIKAALATRQSRQK